MFVDIDAIDDERPVAFDNQLELGSLPLAGAEQCEVLEARLAGVARRGRRGVELEARLAGRLSLGCGRCLERYESTLEVEVFLVLVHAAEFGARESAMDQEDAELFYAEDGRVELERVATEQIYLNLPLKPICRADCRGLCPTCGGNRNRIECGCRSADLDPRLAPLLAFKAGRKKQPGGA